MPRCNVFACRTRVAAAAVLLAPFASDALAQTIDTSSVAPTGAQNGADRRPTVAPGAGPVARPGGPATGGTNDACATAQVIGEGTFPFALQDATNDYPGTCGQTSAAPDRWWAYHPTGSGTATWSTCSLTTLDTVLSVLQACGGPQIACVDDSCALQTQVSFAVTPGNVYLLRLAGYNGVIGSGSFTVSRNAFPPQNDPCASAATIGEGTHPFDTTGAAPDGAASCGSSNASPDVWFAYAATGDGTATVELCGLAVHDSVLSAYTACGGPEIACNDDACGTQSRISFPVASGSTSLIRVSGYNGATGGGSIRVSLGSACFFRHHAFSSPEPEPCGSSSNSGCNLPPGSPPGTLPVYTDVACDTTFAGTCWADGGARDTDWYRINVPVGTPVTVAIQSAFPSVLYAFSEACPPVITLNTDADCSRDGILEFIAGGSTVVFVSVGSNQGPIYSGVPCGLPSTNGYNLSILFDRPCGASCPCDWNHIANVTSQDFFDFIVAFFAGDADYNLDCQTSSQDFFDFIVCFFQGCPGQGVYTLSLGHSGIINGEAFSAVATGYGIPATGEVVARWQLDHRITHFHPLRGIVSPGGTAAGSTVARESGGMVNMLTLAGGNWSFVSQVADVFVTTGTVRSSGNAIDVTCTTTGNDLPEMADDILRILPCTYQQTPGPPGSGLISEPQFDVMQRADGSHVAAESNMTYVVAPNISLPSAQSRSLDVSVLYMSTDQTTAILRCTTGLVGISETRPRCLHRLTSITSDFADCTCDGFVVGTEKCTLNCNTGTDCITFTQTWFCSGTGGTRSCRKIWTPVDCRQPCP